MESRCRFTKTLSSEYATLYVPGPRVVISQSNFIYIRKTIKWKNCQGNDAAQGIETHRIKNKVLKMI